MYSNYKDRVAVKSTTSSSGGLRELKRRRTRATIASAATELFLARGFDQVPVAEIAAAAEVSEKTVFNYFPVKAELVFDAGDELLDELLHAVRHRAVGSPAVAGVRAFIERRAARAERECPPRPTRRFLQLIEASPTLRAYRREMFARWETTLSELLAEETDAATESAEPFVVAVAVVGVLRAGFEAPTRGADLAEHNSLAALDLLSGGLANYAPSPTRQSPRTPPSTECD
jgi:AcrR family transcriptional regulator